MVDGLVQRYYPRLVNLIDELVHRTDLLLFFYFGRLLYLVGATCHAREHKDARELFEDLEVHLRS